MPPINSGIGFRAGFGLVFFQMSRIVSIPRSRFSKRSFSLKNGMPKTECSFSFQPAPTPSRRRPPERASTEAAIFARTAASRNVIGVTMGPNSIFFVHSAVRARDSQHSMQSRSASPISEIM